MFPTNNTSAPPRLPRLRPAISASLRLCASLLLLTAFAFARDNSSKAPKFAFADILLSFAFRVHAAQPNVILIITDDQGYGDVSAHGSPVLKTPNLDKFRDQSVRFTDFHVAPMCSPTRGQLMTGIDAMRTEPNCYGHSARPLRSFDDHAFLRGRTILLLRIGPSLLEVTPGRTPILDDCAVRTSNPNQDTKQARPPGSLAVPTRTRSGD